MFGPKSNSAIVRSKCFRSKCYQPNSSSFPVLSKSIDTKAKPSITMRTRSETLAEPNHKFAFVLPSFVPCFNKQTQYSSRLVPSPSIKANPRQRTLELAQKSIPSPFAPNQSHKCTFDRSQVR
ncbi:unnamed protein product [Lactuca virosa]|uniref:Uncharacterized protein n=1 Tax=Lactuca virosa TaxID=75947 RepID=A0AAU9LKF8_9ASTR|nr:unnamed protein product [Lactuca virosa]